MLRIRLISAPKPNLNHRRVVFDPTIPLDHCDGLLAWGAVTREFLSYRGPRAWYIDEPLSHRMFRKPVFRDAIRTLGEHEFLHASNPNLKYRLPCVTHYDALTLSPTVPRTRDTIAIVSDFGHRIWWFRRHFRLRNSFILHPSVDLYGNAGAWARFRRRPWSKPGPPQNYRGPTSASHWYKPDHIEALAHYRINVCLENASMPYWFTEKFVNAVRAGCVPVYHAHPTVRDGVLRGARWVDPADFAFNVPATLAAARACDAAALREHNYRWLQSEALRLTEGYAIWSRIADLFVERITGTHQTRAHEA
jgi:hypothetical protein